MTIMAGLHQADEGSISIRGRPADLAGWTDQDLWAPCFQAPPRPVKPQ